MTKKKGNNSFTDLARLTVDTLGQLFTKQEKQEKEKYNFIVIITRQSDGKVRIGSDMPPDFVAGVEKLLFHQEGGAPSLDAPRYDAARLGAKETAKVVMNELLRGFGLTSVESKKGRGVGFEKPLNELNSIGETFGLVRERLLELLMVFQAAFLEGSTDREAILRRYLAKVSERDQRVIEHFIRGMNNKDSSIHVKQTEVH